MKKRKVLIKNQESNDSVIILTDMQKEQLEELFKELSEGERLFNAICLWFSEHAINVRPLFYDLLFGAYVNFALGVYYVKLLYASDKDPRENLEDFEDFVECYDYPDGPVKHSETVIKLSL